VSIPGSILKQVYSHYRATDWCIVSLNENNQVIYANQHAQSILKIPNELTDIKKTLPLVTAESLEEPFVIPFYNHHDKIYDVHFILEGKAKYIVMVPIDIVHQQVQFKQQMAHEQVIEKLRIQDLFSTLEDAHEELKEANSAKSFYISALSHEIGNPITAIKGYNKLLTEGSIEKAEATTIIGKNIEKIQQIINQTLDYDQQYTTQYSLKLSPAEMIDDLFNDFRIQALSKALTLHNQIDHNIVINTNKTKWNQIFTNLISNAIKYTDTGEITVKSIVEDGLLHIDVIDTGIGMSQKFQQQLFTAWSREKKDQTQGNGIGLVISKMLAEQVGADLILHSSDTHGSRFRFSVNYFKPQKSQRILLVDDDIDCLNLFKYYLSQAGHQVKTADSVANLQSQLEQHNFDTLITDLNLSDGEVHKVFGEFENKVQTRIVMTANPTTEKIEELNQMGFDQVLTKPLSQEKLVNSIK